METNEKVLCGANSYTKKYYLNPKFEKLPMEVQYELKLMCIGYVEEAGGIITLEFNENDILVIKTNVDDGDYLFDEIESGLIISKMQKEKEQLFEELTLFYKVMVNGTKL